MHKQTSEQSTTMVLSPSLARTQRRPKRKKIPIVPSTPPINSFFRAKGNNKRSPIVLDGTRNWDENNVNGKAKRAFKRIRKSFGEGTATVPLQLLSSTESSHKSRSSLVDHVRRKKVACNTNAKPHSKAIPTEIITSCRTKKTQSNHTKGLAPLTRTTLLVTKTTEPPTSGVGLVRICDATEVPQSLCAPPNDTVRPLFAGATLGRNISHFTSKIWHKTRIDLGITPIQNSLGVSRKHLKVHSVSSDSVTFQHLEVSQKVGYQLYDSKKNKMEKHFKHLEQGDTITFHLGDAIIFDEYNRKKESMPVHLFRVVSVPSTTSFHCHQARAVATSTGTTSSSRPLRGQDSLRADYGPDDVSKTIAIEGSVPVDDGFVAAAGDVIVNGNGEAASSLLVPGTATTSVATGVADSNDFSKETAQIPFKVSSMKDADVLMGAISKDTAVEQEKRHIRPLELDSSSNAGAEAELYIACAAVEPYITSADNNSHEMQVSKDAIVEPIAKKAETLAPTPVVCPPIVGERFWIKFQRKEKDRFGSTASSWFVGTAFEVTKMPNSKKTLFSIKVKYEDETEEVLDFPSKLVWRLQAEPGTTIFNALSCHCTQQKTAFAYDSSPKELHAGDLVDCNYQNGGSHGFWYRGRVACDSADKKFFDVAYEDGEFECGIPIEGDNFRLIERGIDNCKWMVRLPIVEKFNPEKQKSTRKGIITKIERSEDDGSVFFKVRSSDGSSESWPYADAMQTLFESEREASFNEHKIRCWPQAVLHVGDLVHGYNQNGAPHNVWHRGRIAAISDDQKKYDVCYDDNDYECGIPIEKVRLFRQHKMDASSWVCGMDIVVEPRRQKRKRKGSVEKSERTHTCTDSFQVNFSDGTCESMTYMKIAMAWFAEQYDIRSRKKLVTNWPSDPIQKTGEEADNDDQVDMIKESLDEDANKHTVDTNEQLNMSQDFCDFSAVEDEERNCHNVREMNQSVASLLYRSLNSAEPHSGAELLSHMSTFHSVIPNKVHCRKLFDIMTHGPQSEDTTFNDPNRMELAFNYATLLSENPIAMNVASGNMTPSSWNEFAIAVNQSCSEIYRAPEDASQITYSALGRIAESLQVAACSAESIVSQFQFQLKEDMQNDDSVSKKLYRSKPIVKMLLSCRGGIREVVKSVSGMNMRSWMKNGQFVLNGHTVLHLVEDSAESNSSMQFCVDEANRCLMALGKITSYVLWLLSVEEGTGIGAKSCAFVVKDAILHEMQTDAFDPSPFIQATKGKKKNDLKNEYLKRLKLWFLLYLDDDIVSPLRLTLSKMLGVSKELGALSI